MKKFTAKDVFEQIDLTGMPHGGKWAFNATSGFGWYEEGDGKAGIPLLESIAESLSMDGTEVKGIFTIEERKALKEIAVRYIESEIYGAR